MLKKRTGEYTVVGLANVWPHEIETAKVLKNAGHIVKFIPASKRKFENTADCYIDGVLWEMKSPRASSLKTVERNLKRGSWQSDKIVFDSRRMKLIPDKAIGRELTKRLKEIDRINQIKFVNRHGKVIDIK